MTDDRIQELLDAPPTAAELHAQQIRDEIDALPALELRACLVMQRLEIERLRCALAELVALKDIKVSLPLWPFSPDPDADKRADYARRQPLAWAAARKALGVLA